ncbi:uncharacterized protein LOC143208780 isoform X2 [Lasioglossum baleicum]|uniref:uncharacterized protein LOC143208780 isoform X2 n=1 Tax=Lasioglossum baleicum TaxID=434251 RepID=UPI003FCDABE3
MEQYRGCGNVPEDSSAPQEDKQIGAGSSSSFSKDKTNCSDGKQCSGFGWCSPANKDENGGKVSFQHGQVNLTQADNKNEPGLQGRTSTDKNPRTTVLSNSLTTLSQKISYRSKNTCKGASGDKINKSVSVRASSKRRLILVSPYEKESEAKLTRTTDLEEFYCIAQANRNIFGYYNNSKIAKLGGGDENITIIQSPRTEVWLSGFWTT